MKNTELIRKAREKLEYSRKEKKSQANCIKEWENCFRDLPPLNQELFEKDYEQIADTINSDGTLTPSNKVWKFYQYEELREEYEMIQLYDKHHKRSAMEKCMAQTAKKTKPAIQDEIER